MSAERKESANFAYMITHICTHIFDRKWDGGGGDVQHGSQG